MACRGAAAGQAAWRRRFAAGVKGELSYYRLSSLLKVQADYLI